MTLTKTQALALASRLRDNDETIREAATAVGLGEATQIELRRGLNQHLTNAQRKTLNRHTIRPRAIRRWVANIDTADPKAVNEWKKLATDIRNKFGE